MKIPRNKHTQKFHNITPRFFCGNDGSESLQHRPFSRLWSGTPCTLSVPLVGVLAMAFANYVAINGRLMLMVASIGTVPAEQNPSVFVKVFAGILPGSLLGPHVCEVRALHNPKTKHARAHVHVLQRNLKYQWYGIGSACDCYGQSYLEH